MRRTGLFGRSLEIRGLGIERPLRGNCLGRYCYRHRRLVVRRASPAGVVLRDRPRPGMR